MASRAAVISWLGERSARGGILPRASAMCRTQLLFLVGRTVRRQISQIVEAKRRKKDRWLSPPPMHARRDASPTPRRLAGRAGRSYVRVSPPRPQSRPAGGVRASHERRTRAGSAGLRENRWPPEFG